MEKNTKRSTWVKPILTALSNPRVINIKKNRIPHIDDPGSVEMASG
jgi:hypothetical protein